MKKEEYMLRALELAREAAIAGEVPVGAVIVERSSGEIIGEGANCCEALRDATAHAEINAIRSASMKKGDWRLSGCDLYVTLEPCPMCAGAILTSRIERVYFGAQDERNGAVCSAVEMFRAPFNPHPDWFLGPMEDECKNILSDFFSSLRK